MKKIIRNSSFFNIYIILRNYIILTIFPNGDFKVSGLEVVKSDSRVEEKIYNVQDGFDGSIIFQNVWESEILEKLSICTSIKK